MFLLRLHQYTYTGRTYMTKKDTAAAKPKTPKKKTIKKKAAKKKTAIKKAAGTTNKRTKKATTVSDEKRRMMVAMHAYYKWENSGRPDNAETHYWLEAEKEVDDMLR